MLLHNCTHAQPDWRTQVVLSVPHVEALMAVLAHEGDSSGSYADAFEWVVLFLEGAFKAGLLPEIWASIASGDLSCVATLPPLVAMATLPNQAWLCSARCSVNKAQVLLLKILDGLTDRLAKVTDGYASPHS
jgi:hypothetical protein